MSDRTFVLAMWQFDKREWSDTFALEWVLTSAEAFSRGIATARNHLLAVREVREAQRRYQQLRLDGVSPAVALFQMAHPNDSSPAGLDPRPRGRRTGDAATHC